MLESYWDWLPPELTAHIKSSVLNQCWLNVQKEELECQLQKALVTYHELQKAWGLGLIQLKWVQGVLQVKGCYVDWENRHRTVFLCQGSLDNALRRVEHVKSLYKKAC